MKLCAVVLIALAVIGVAAVVPPDQLTARKITLVNAKGEPRLVLGVNDEGQSYVEGLLPDGRASFTLAEGAEGAGYLILSSPKYNQQIRLVTYGEQVGVPNEGTGIGVIK
jgi:hypothetical protein